jgi:hypothetical protein
MYRKRIVGVSPWSNPNYELMKQAGIEWVRITYPFPYVDRLGGAYDERFLQQVRLTRQLGEMGLRVMGETPLAGVMSATALGAGHGETQQPASWRPFLPEWAGTPEQDSYYEAYEEGCAEIARQTLGVADLWQISNEMDIVEFRGPLTMEQAARFLVAGARGVKKVHPAAKADTNPANYNSENGRWLFQTLYGQHGDLFDYAGIDGYYGSWAPGGPEKWVEVLNQVHELTGAPVLVNEWGYSSLGGAPRPPRGPVPPGQNTVCDTQAWHYVWKAEHSEQEQAEYLRVGLQIFATHPHCAGSFIYNWGDDATCWHCGRSLCPAECGWGIVDSQGRPKVGYYTVRDVVARYY